MVAVAGTATTLAAMNLGLKHWDRQKVHGSHLSISALEEDLKPPSQHAGTAPHMGGSQP